MSQRTQYLLAAFFLAASFPTASRAQENPPAAGGQAPQPAPQVTSTAQPAPKKVWTNDDVGDLRQQSAISTSSGPSGKPVKPGERPANSSRGKDAKWYRDQIAKFQAQIPPLDSQIAQLQAAINGKPTGDGKDSSRPRGVKGGSWETELTELQAKRDDIAGRISTLQDQARHAGVPAEALP